VVTRRGDIPRINHEFPHAVALPAKALHGSVNGTAVFGFAKTLSRALRPYRLERDGRELVVFCFSRLGDARHSPSGSAAISWDKSRSKRELRKSRSGLRVAPRAFDLCVACLELRLPNGGPAQQVRLPSQAMLSRKSNLALG